MRETIRLMLWIGLGTGVLIDLVTWLHSMEMGFGLGWGIGVLRRKTSTVRLEETRS